MPLSYLYDTADRQTLKQSHRHPQPRRLVGPEAVTMTTSIAMRVWFLNIQRRPLLTEIVHFRIHTTSDNHYSDGNVQFRLFSLNYGLTRLLLLSVPLYTTGWGGVRGGAPRHWAGLHPTTMKGRGWVPATTATLTQTAPSVLCINWTRTQWCSDY